MHISMATWCCQGDSVIVWGYYADKAPGAQIVLLRWLLIRTDPPPSSHHRTCMCHYFLPRHTTGLCLRPVYTTVNIYAHIQITHSSLAFWDKQGLESSPKATSGALIIEWSLVPQYVGHVPLPNTVKTGKNSTKHGPKHCHIGHHALFLSSLTALQPIHSPRYFRMPLKAHAFTELKSCTKKHAMLSLHCNHGTEIKANHMEEHNYLGVKISLIMYL